MINTADISPSESVGQNWFPVAVHVLALLAASNDGMSSSRLAGSVNTHAVFLRRIVAHLVRAGLVHAREGRDGGYRLARPADSISLAEVYGVMRSGGPLPVSTAEPNRLCPVGAGIRTALGEVGTEVEAELVRGLARHTIGEISSRSIELGRTQPP